MVLHGFPSFCSTVDRGYYTVDVRSGAREILGKEKSIRGVILGAAGGCSAGRIYHCERSGDASGVGFLSQRSKGSKKQRG
jgi:hypothetical protein